MVRNVVASKDVVSGIILVNSIDAYVLFNLGVTCSFVSHEFAKHLNLPFEQLDYPLNVKVAIKEVFSTYIKITMYKLEDTNSLYTLSLFNWGSLI